MVVVAELRVNTPVVRLFGAAALLALLMLFPDAADEPTVVFGCDEDAPPEVSGGSEPMKLFIMLKLLLMTLPLAWMF